MIRSATSDACYLDCVACSIRALAISKYLSSRSMPMNLRFVFAQATPVQFVALLNDALLIGFDLINIRHGLRLLRQSALG